MPRARSGAARHRKKVRLFRQTKGYRGPRRNRWRLAKEAVLRAGVNAYRDRRRRKREFRSLWITRLSAACQSRGIQYSRLISGLRIANVILDRKMLSELAIHDPAAFDAIVDLAKQNVRKQAA
ncbi:MAG: 50S ribosomal protein L20 [Planctomycetes bacterium]|nr:50S ribosomal protein L20 [Planctomycetota bacterium]MCH8965645.1 50S ribosomal protein L20 [Planctomycetota bacterium]